MLAIGQRVADQRDGESLRLAALRVETGLKLPDCCALDTALTLESTLTTFDERLTDAARAPPQGRPRLGQTPSAPRSSFRPGSTGALPVHDDLTIPQVALSPEQAGALTSGVDDPRVDSVKTQTTEVVGGAGGEGDPTRPADGRDLGIEAEDGRSGRFALGDVVAALVGGGGAKLALPR